MINYLWGIMIAAGVIYGCMTGKAAEINTEIIESAKSAVSLCITMLGIMSVWTGLMKIAENSGIIGGLTKVMYPVVRFLFPKIPKEHEALEHITTNIIANMLGLGWAATPAGLKGMQSLKKFEEERGRKTDVASDEMCNFLIINISSLQLIPINVIAYRSQYGSENPTGIIIPAIIATLISNVAAVVFCRLMNMRRKKFT